MSQEKNDETKKSVQLNPQELQDVAGGSAGYVNGWIQLGDVHGTDGDDTIEGSLVFSWVGDNIDGGAGNDKIWGEGGDDNLKGGTGNDTIFGGTGNDTIDGGADNDELQGGSGDDTILGGTGNDTLFGDSGNDKLAGGDGNDKLYGGDGNDTLTGGDGADTFVFSPQGGNDTITDFDPTEGDKIRINFGQNVVFHSDSQTITYNDQDGNQSTITLQGGNFSYSDLTKSMVDYNGNSISLGYSKS